MSSKEKIALIGPYPPPYGGISVHIMRLLRVLPPHSYTLYCTTRYRPEGSINFFGKHKLLKFIFLLIKPYKIIHVHSTDSLSRLFFGFLGIFRKNIYLHMHGVSLLEYVARGKTGPRLLRFLIRYLNILAVNEELAKKVIDFRPRSVHVVDPFLPPEISLEELQQVKEKHREFFSSSKTILSMTGWFDLFKGKDLYGFDIASEIIARFKENGINVFLFACVNGIRNKNLYERFNAFLKEKNIEDRVSLIFDSGSVWPYIMLSDIFIRPTCTDGSSVSVMEAIWTTTPVIASDCVIRPVEVTLFRDRDSQDLYRKVNEMMTTNLLNWEEKFKTTTEKKFENKLIQDIYSLK